jgi:hypothetical protein
MGIRHACFQANNAVFHSPFIRIPLQMFNVWNAVAAVIIGVDTDPNTSYSLLQETSLIPFDPDIKQACASSCIFSHELGWLQTTRPTALGINDARSVYLPDLG